MPALLSHHELRNGLVFVDPSPARRTALRVAAGGGREASSLDDVLSAIDGAIITAPHALHVPLASQLIDAKVPILCEKPLAARASEAKRIVTRARELGVPFAVNNTRRLYPTNDRIKAMLTAGELGVLQEVQWSEGDKFDWPLASPSLFGQSSGGRGVLLDIGAHVLDLLCWWLGRAPEVKKFQDDSLGGSEAWCRAMLHTEQCSIDVRLSWLSRQRNRFFLRGTEGTISGGIYDWSSFLLERGRTRTTVMAGSKSETLASIAQRMVDNFIDVVRGDAAPIVTADSVLDSLTLIEECYASREQAPMSWVDTWRRVV